jgi:hypothetical protein
MGLLEGVIAEEIHIAYNCKRFTAVVKQYCHTCVIMLFDWLVLGKHNDAS